MRTARWPGLLLLTVLIGCGDDGGDGQPDAGPTVDASSAADATPVDAGGSDAGGSGDIGASSTSHDFAIVEVSQSSSFDWTVTNAGAQATGTLELTNDNETQFQVTNGCTGSLAPGASCTVSVSFSPQAGGDHSAILRLSATPGGIASVALSGHGGHRLTVSVSGTGRVTSTPAGLDCPGSCEALFRHDSAVTLTATTSNGDDSVFRSWSEPGCPGLDRECALTVSAGASVTATFAALTQNLIFYSSTRVSSDLGGATAYDTVCNDLATAAGINNAGGNGYIAMISDTNSLGMDRLGSARGWVRMDGRAFADEVTDLFGQEEVFYPVGFNETGAPVGGSAFTSTSHDGTLVPDRHCNNWTTTAGSSRGGSATGGPRNWIVSGGFSCGMAHLICMGTTKTAAVAPVATSGKRIYLSNSGLAVGSQTPDSLCQASAPAGVTTAAALVATTTAAADSVLNAADTYVRPDGVLVGTGAEIAAGGALTSGLWQDGSGGYAQATVWTGHTDLTTVGTTASTCDDWSDNGAGPGRYGFNGRSSGGWWSYFDANCNLSYRLYCVEQ